MDNLEQWIPADLRKVVADRSLLWRTFDQAHHQFRGMEQQSPQVASSPLAEISPPLSQVDTPPAEVLAAVVHFDEQLQKINKNNALRSDHQEEINRLKYRQGTLLIVAGIVLVLIMIALLSGVLPLW